VYALLPPSAGNLAAFAAWASSAAQHQPMLLAEHAEGALRVEVCAGATLLIPGARLTFTAPPARLSSASCKRTLTESSMSGMRKGPTEMEPLNGCC
jgi:hypothetical protein